MADETRKKIVVADDSATARMIIKKCLEIAGFQEAEFIEAENGREALRLLKTNKIDLLLSDFNMPVMDGGVLLKWVKGSPNTKDIPVVIVTSAGNPAREKELKDLGAYAVLSKPISPAVISQELEELIDSEEEEGFDEW